jgi:hypothetical protein
MNDAEFWKAELWRETSRLREALEQEGRDYYAARPAFVERYAFVTAYEMRKLEDAEALTLDVTDQSYDFLAYPAIKPPRDVYDLLLRKDGHRFRVALDLHYDLEHPQPAKLKFRYLCNRLIHHLAFDVREHPASEHLELLFTDTDHKDTLHGIALEAWIALVLEAHYDEIRWVGVNEKGKRIRRRQRPPV